MTGTTDAKLTGKRRGRPPGSKANNAAGAAARVRVVDSALELFGQRGFHGVSFADLAKASGLAKATVAHHFKSKEKLYSSVLDQVAGDMQTFLTPSFEASSGSRDSVKLLISGIVDWGLQCPHQTRLVAFELLELPNRSSAPRKWNLAPVVRQTLVIIEKARRNKYVLDCPSYIVLETLLGSATYHLMAEPLEPYIVENNEEILNSDDFRSYACQLLERLVLI